MQCRAGTRQVSAFCWSITPECQARIVVMKGLKHRHLSARGVTHACARQAQCKAVRGPPAGYDFRRFCCAVTTSQWTAPCPGWRGVALVIFACLRRAESTPSSLQLIEQQYPDILDLARSGATLQSVQKKTGTSLHNAQICIAAQAKTCACFVATAGKCAGALVAVPRRHDYTERRTDGYRVRPASSVNRAMPHDPLSCVRFWPLLGGPPHQGSS